MKRLLIVTIGFGLLVLIASEASAAPTVTAAPTGSGGYVPGQVLVKFE